MLVERAGRIGLRGRLRRLLRIPFRRLEMKMKRTIQLIIVYCLLTIAVCYAVFESEPEPVEVKPVLVKTAKQWDLTKAYYQKVTMPDGSRQELKIRPDPDPNVPPPDAKQWEALAQKQWDAMKAGELSQPENCMDCHAKCGRKT